MAAKQNKQEVKNNPNTAISKEGLAARRSYYRRYYQQNKRQIQANQKAYWDRIGKSSETREIAED